MTKEKSTKKEFTINELLSAENSISVFRACPAITFQQANDINANYGPVKTAITKHNDKLEILRERNIALQEIKETDTDGYKKKTEDDKRALIELFKTKHTIEPKILIMAQFKDMEINGEKEIKQQDGSTCRFPYRDAYFNLVDLGLIA